ncbi:hypothetical protein PHET_10285 [Paragonimus heterotremus]|uniref:Uncharacterized protein n=1 Tax=Paragonimus heterotremus TaxID=100268 RepID=A0A8J4SJW3_9TREM|nr:hypothetical protein PHET_10285 [Paragonimus heterotremus]
MSASDTLFELRVALQLAEVERIGGFYPHISPFVDNVDLGELLHRVGFNLITLDIEELVVHYPDMFCLMDDLRGMGESNAAFNRPIQVHRDVLFAASAIYDGGFKVTVGMYFSILCQGISQILKFLVRPWCYIAFTSFCN